VRLDLTKHNRNIRSKRDQHAFVDAVVAGRIAVWRRPAEEVVDDILTLATTADRTEARNMLKMQLASMTSERLVELEGRIRSLETQIAVLEGKTPQLIWSADLDALEKYL
jgi:polyhydroxyalkanoate synthesis regulator phasin